MFSIRGGGEPKAPSQNPFTLSCRDAPIEAGTRISFLLGGEGASSRRVVSGTVRTYAVRASSIEFRVDHLVTWIHHIPPIDLEELPESFSTVFEVALQGSVAETVAALVDPAGAGRARIEAREVPQYQCPSCGTRAHQLPFCGRCGRRNHLGLGEARPAAEPTGVGEGFCPGCWRDETGRGGFCRFCGFDRSLLGEAASSIEGARDFLLVARRQRLGQFRARVEGAEARRVYRSGDTQLLLHVGDVTYDERSVRDVMGPVPSAAFRCVLTFGPRPGTVESLLAELAAGRGALRVAELKRRCWACVGDGPGDAPYVLGRYCTQCGERSRIALHPDWTRRVEQSASSRPARHECGAVFRPERDRYCGQCGESVQSYRASSGRFARIR